MFELAPHQAEAISKLKTGSVLVGGVGSGKSITSLAYFTALDPTRKIVVITTAKKRDSGEWWADAMKMSLRNEFHVDSWNNLNKYLDQHAFFIFDEQKLVGDGAWSKAFLEIAAHNEWILLTATPSDVWMDLMIVFIANGFYRNKSDFINRHVMYSRFTKYPKVERYLDPWVLEKHRADIFVEMPYLKTATREEHLIEVGFDREAEKLIYTARWNAAENRPIKDAGEMMRLLRKSANSHPSRYENLIKVCSTTPRVIVFYNHDYELEILRCLHTELDIPVAEWNGHNHQDIPQTDRWLYLVQYEAGAEGWNCVSTDTIVFWSLPYAYRRLEQAMGRIDRLNTTYSVLHYYIFKSQAIIDRGIWQGLGRKKNFQVGAFAKKAWPKEEKFTRLN